MAASHLKSVLFTTLFLFNNLFGSNSASLSFLSWFGGLEPFHHLVMLSFYSGLLASKLRCIVKVVPGHKHNIGLLWNLRNWIKEGGNSGPGIQLLLEMREPLPIVWVLPAQRERGEIRKSYWDYFWMLILLLIFLSMLTLLIFLTYCRKVCDGQCISDPSILVSDKK